MYGEGLDMYPSGFSIRDARPVNEGAKERNQCEIVLDMLPVGDHGNYTYSARGQTERYPCSGPEDRGICKGEVVFVHTGPNTFPCADQESSGASLRVFSTVSGMPKHVDFAVMGNARGDYSDADQVTRSKLINIQVAGLAKTEPNSPYAFMPNDWIFADVQPVGGELQGDKTSKTRIRPLLFPLSLQNTDGLLRPLYETEEAHHAVLDSVDGNILGALTSNEIITRLREEGQRVGSATYTPFAVIAGDVALDAYRERIAKDSQFLLNLGAAHQLPADSKNPGRDGDGLWNARIAKTAYFALRRIELTSGAPPLALAGKFVALEHESSKHEAVLAVREINHRRKRCVGRAVAYCPPFGSELVYLQGSG